MDIWQSRGMFSCPTILKDDTAESRKVIIESSRKLMDNFIQKYHKANPTRARVSKPDSPSAEEQNMISQFIQGKSSDNELKDLSRFFPAIDFRGTESGYLRGPTPKQMVIIEKIVNKYALALKKNDIPQTDLSTWTKDPIKTHMKYSLIISEDFAMFTLALFDRYVLKRNPEEFEYWSIWAHNQSFEGEEVSRAKAVNFFMAQNTMALKEFVRDYKAANPSKVNQ